ncbi:MAG: zinc ribbon domain-containing protein [Planctomycetota bacterium]
MAGPWESTKTGAPRLQHQMRKIGNGLVWVGAILLVVSIFDMALSVTRGGMLKFFWIGFFAVPMIVAGVFLNRFATVVRVVGQLEGNPSQEAFLSAAKTLVKKHPGVKLLSVVLGKSAENVHHVHAVPHGVTCSTCENRNDGAARFCDGCGAALIAGLACPSCDALNDSTARTCIACDERL